MPRPPHCSMAPGACQPARAAPRTVLLLGLIAALCDSAQAQERAFDRLVVADAVRLLQHPDPLQHRRSLCQSSPLDGQLSSTKEVVRGLIEHPALLIVIADSCYVWCQVGGIEVDKGRCDLAMELLMFVRGQILKQPLSQLVMGEAPGLLADF